MNSLEYEILAFVEQRNGAKYLDIVSSCGSSYIRTEDVLLCLKKKDYVVFSSAYASNCFVDISPKGISELVGYRDSLTKDALNCVSNKSNNPNEVPRIRKRSNLLCHLKKFVIVIAAVFGIFASVATILDFLL